MNTSRAPGTTPHARHRIGVLARECVRAHDAGERGCGRRSPTPANPSSAARNHVLGMRGSAQKRKIRHRRQFCEARLRPDQGAPLLCRGNGQNKSMRTNIEQSCARTQAPGLCRKFRPPEEFARQFVFPTEPRDGRALSPIPCRLRPLSAPLRRRTGGGNARVDGDGDFGIGEPAPLTPPIDDRGAGREPPEVSTSTAMRRVSTSVGSSATATANGSCIVKMRLPSFPSARNRSATHPRESG